MSIPDALRAHFEQESQNTLTYVVAAASEVYARGDAELGDKLAFETQNLNISDQFRRMTLRAGEPVVPVNLIALVEILGAKLIVIAKVDIIPGNNRAEVSRATTSGVSEAVFLENWKEVSVNTIVFSGSKPTCFGDLTAERLAGL